jgi:hypothetical protein
LALNRGEADDAAQADRYAQLGRAPGTSPAPLLPPLGDLPTRLGQAPVDRPFPGLRGRGGSARRLNAVAAGVGGSRTGAPGQRRSGEEPNHQQGTQDDGQPRCPAGDGSHAVVSFAPAKLRRRYIGRNSGRSSTFSACWQSRLNRPNGPGGAVPTTVLGRRRALDSNRPDGHHGPHPARSLNRSVRAGSARHREPLVSHGHDRSRPAHRNRRSQGIHRSDLAGQNSLVPGFEPLSLRAEDGCVLGRALGVPQAGVRSGRGRSPAVRRRGAGQDRGPLTSGPREPSKLVTDGQDTSWQQRTAAGPAQCRWLRPGPPQRRTTLPRC